jgi:hypothetical protein
MDWWNKTHYDQSEFKKRADKKNKEK